MPEYRRNYVPGGTLFFTVVTHERRRFLTTPLARRCLREAILTIQAKRPFEIVGIVLLPDHLHAIWTLPGGDADYSTRWRRIKEEFTILYLAKGGTEGRRSTSRRKRQERGIWQRRFWEHTIESDAELERHLDYTHYNPVKHGLVENPRDWPYSSFHRWVQKGAYDVNWGCAASGLMKFDDLDETAME